MIFGSMRRGRVFVYREPVDMRKAYDTLAALVEGPMQQSLLSGDVFVFIGRTRKRAKALYFDGTGLCLLCKRLGDRPFRGAVEAAGGGPAAAHDERARALARGQRARAARPAQPRAVPADAGRRARLTTR